MAKMSSSESSEQMLIISSIHTKSTRSFRKGWVWWSALWFTTYLCCSPCLFTMRMSSCCSLVASTLAYHVSALCLLQSGSKQARLPGVYLVVWQPARWFATLVGKQHAGLPRIVFMLVARTDWVAIGGGLVARALVFHVC